MDLDSPWDSDQGFVQQSEWTKISSEFTNVGTPPIVVLQIPIIISIQSGYREGITAGKESALQSGFDAGFAEIGVPLGREIGLLRGIASAISALLSSDVEIENKEAMITNVREIQSQLSEVRFSDIVPRDLEAEEHAKEHLAAEGDDDIIEDEDLVEKRRMERLEDMMSAMATDPTADQRKRLNANDVSSLKQNLAETARRLDVDMSMF